MRPRLLARIALWPTKTPIFAKPQTRRPHPSKRIPPSSPRCSASLRPSAIVSLRSTRARRRAMF